VAGGGVTVAPSSARSGFGLLGMRLFRIVEVRDKEGERGRSGAKDSKAQLLREYIAQERFLNGRYILTRSTLNTIQVIRKERGTKNNKNKHDIKYQPRQNLLTCAQRPQPSQITTRVEYT